MDDIDRVLDRIGEEIATLGLDCIVVDGLDIRCEYEQIPIMAMGKTHPVAYAPGLVTYTVSAGQWEKLNNAVLPLRDSHPENPLVGTAYLNQSESQLYIYAGEAGWLPITSFHSD